jgi:hypothetical protein
MLQLISGLSMRTLNAALTLALGTVLLIGTAEAGGTIYLTDLMDRLKDNDKLIAEINAELKVQKLEAASVICTGDRFGGNWTELGGVRVAPYECEIGARKLDIDGTLHLYDAKGVEVDQKDKTAPERAVDHKETDITWTWK